MNYRTVSGCIFVLVALVHAARALAAITVQIDGRPVGMWVSWTAVVIAGTLAVWAFRSRTD